MTELVWDRADARRARRPAAALGGEEGHWSDPTTLDVVLRYGMKWRDGKPVTIDDVMFSYQAPMGDKSPMYKPFVDEHRLRSRRPAPTACASS